LNYKLTDMTTDNITDYLIMRANEAQEGLTDSLDVYTMLHTIEKLSGDLKKAIFEQVESEISKYGKETPERNGFKLQIGRRKNWGYNDPELDRLKTLQKNRQEMAKQAYSMRSKGAEMYDENGEIIPPAEFTETQFIICKS
jgi:hypothetical protein